MPPAVDVARITELATASVVEIVNNDAAGTGWIYRVDRNGKAWILTNEHVVRGARTVSVRQTGGFGVRVGTVVGLDDIRDLAVVTICCNSSWQALRTDTTTTLRPGSAVVALGFPDERVGTDLSGTAGVVSSYGFHDESRSWIIQTDAVLNPGNSGGPLLNAEGQVIGLVSARVDPALGENIGFAISMRTVEQELDFLEAGETVMVDPTPSPTRTPTSVPTAVPSAGVSGELMHDPTTGNIGCHGGVHDATAISDDTVDSAGFLRFKVPDVRRWSIGFLYHDIEDDFDSATFVWSEGPYDTFARHWARRNGIVVHDPPEERIGRQVLKVGNGQSNELAFRTSADGSFLRLNDETVIEVPASQLIRRSGWSSLCIGFHSEEDEPYSIPYSDLRTRFVHAGVSGSLTHSGSNVDWWVECTKVVSAPSYLASSATDSWIVFDFVVPNGTEWRIDFIYHDNYELSDNESGFTVSTIGGHGSEFGVNHYRYDNLWNRYQGMVRESFADPPMNDGRKNRVEFQTSRHGTSIFINGVKVSEVKGSELVRREGSLRLCAQHSDEKPPYTIRLSDLWAWAD